MEITNIAQLLSPTEAPMLKSGFKQLTVRRNGKFTPVSSVAEFDESIYAEVEVRAADCLERINTLPFSSVG